MTSTGTIAIIAVAVVGLFLIYENQQQQQQVSNAILVKIATTPTVIPQTNPLASLASIVTPILAAL